MSKLISFIVFLSLFFLISCNGKEENHSIHQIKNANFDLSIERIHSSPSLSGSIPRGVQFSPDSKRLTYLKAKKDNKQVLDLWEFNLSTMTHQKLVDSTELLGAKGESLSEEEKSRRERLRIKNSGIITFEWNKQGTAILFPLSGDLYLYELKNKAVTRVTNTELGETDSRFSPKGRYISFVRNKNVYVYDINQKQEKQISFGGGGLIKNGMAEFVAQEEMGRFTGYWWSKDEKYIAFTEVDESSVKEDVRTEINANNTIVKKQRYPYTGTPNAQVKLFITDLTHPKSKKREVPKSGGASSYLTRVTWHPRQPILYFQEQSRDQKKHTLFSFHAINQNLKPLIVETSDRWVNILGKPKFLKKSDHFIWQSERTGFNHLYLYQDNGEMVRPLTRGEWVVTGLAGVDEKRDLLYFTATKKSPTERQLYKTKLSQPEDMQRMTPLDGTYGARFSDSGQYFVEYFSNTQTPPQVQLKTAQGKKLTWLSENKVDKNHPLFPYQTQLAQYEFGTLQTDEKVKLHYSLLKPNNFDPQKKYPLIIYVYGGPHTQLVRKSWKGNVGFLQQLLVSQGYLVLTVDNRGSNYRGTAFEFPIYKQLGHIEVSDQISGLNHFIKKGYVDSKRVGVTGHSYGGYMTLMLMAKHPKVFKAGVSVAPVIDWKLYDTHYTERYMSSPSTNPEGYTNSNVLTYAKDITGDLLVVHGMADDNVLFKNATMLFHELQNRGIPFDSMAYPGAKHGLYGKKTQIHYYRTLLRHFKQHL